MAYAALGAPRPGTAYPLPFLFFYSNLTKAAGLDAGSSVLTVLWSIAVEEQFYLAWPLLLVAVPRRLAALPPALLLLASILFRIAHPDHGVRLWHSFACMGDLAMGGLAAAWLDTGRGRVAVSRWGTSTALLLHAALIGLYALAAHLRALPEGDVWHPVLFAAAAAGVVLYQTAGAAGPLQLPPAGPLAELGRISYGLYCLHMIGVLAVVQVMTMLGLGGRLWHVVLLQPVAALVLTVTLAQLSYRWLELPFLRLKDRFSYIRR
jgi:peptidoglycan/LPS O-acetylase OafA/YrhL